MTLNRWNRNVAIQALHAKGLSYVEIARKTGCDYRTVRRYLEDGIPESRDSHRKYGDNVEIGLRTMLEERVEGERFSCGNIATVCGVTKQFINQIEKRALRKLRLLGLNELRDK